MTPYGFIFYLLVLIFSVVIHEVSHGLAARALGDDTAEREGRLTLNPLRHIDPIGSIAVPLLMYLSHLGGLAWAKPVPYNPAKLYKDFIYGPLKVALAGPLSNISLVVLFGLLARIFISVLNPAVIGLFGFIALLNAFLAVFNLVPIPPLDGSKILPLILPYSWGVRVERIGLGGIFFVFIFIYFFSPFISTAALWLFGLIGGDGVVNTTFAVIQNLGLL
jgi:Zn-dependent protease